LSCQIKQTKLLLFLRNHFIEKRQVVAEKENARRIIDLRVLADVTLKKNGRHGRDIFMAETQIGAGKSSIARFHACNPDLAFFINHVPREYLLGQGHGMLACLDWRQKHLPLHPRHIERKQAAVFNYLTRDLIFPCRKLRERNLFPTTNPVDQRKVRRSQHAQVLAILLIDPFNILGDHHADAGAHLGIRRLLAARSFTAPLSAHGAHKSAALHLAAPNRRHTAALQPQIRNLAQRLIEVKAVVRRSDLIGRDVVAQLRIVGRILRIPGQVFTRELTLDEFRVFGEKKNAPLQPDSVRPLFDFAFQKRVDHVEPVGS
jgi:hypothetical protein